MQIADVPDYSLANLDDKTLLALSRHWGKVGQVAQRRFLATLPEVERRGLYRRARCHSIQEYASKYGGASREVVDTVFRVYRRIGGYEVLWSLFVKGNIGLSIFRRISPHVTADNAAWWAEIVQSCSLRDIERILDEFDEAGPGQEAAGQLRFGGTEHGKAADGRAAAKVAPEAPGDRVAGEAVTELPGDRGMGEAALEPPGDRGAGEAVPKRPVKRGVAELVTERPGNRGVAELVTEPPGDRGGVGAAPEPMVDRAAIGAALEPPGDRGVAKAVPEPPGDGGVVGAVPDSFGGAGCPADDHLYTGSQRTPDRSTSLTPVAAQIAENLVAEYRRRGLTVSVREVIEAALRQVAIQGVLPAISGGGSSLLAASPVLQDTAGVRPCRHPGNEPAEAGMAAQSAGEATPSAGAASQGLAVPDGETEAAVPEPFGQGRLGDGLPAAPRRVRLPRVLISLSEVGMTFLRTIGGLIPLTDGEASVLDAGRPPIRFPDLLAAAEDAGRRATGRAVPGSVKLAIWLRSAGRCEAQGCTGVIEELDHLDPYSEVLAHLPGRMAGLCFRCHRARHEGLIANPGDPPAQWRYRTAGSPRRSGTVDHQVHECRERARSATLLPPQQFLA